MMFPTIHLNGSAGDDLLSQVIDAMLALSDAIKAVQAAGPNGRDYYLHGNSAFPRALAEHEERIAKLEAVQTDLVAISESIHAQMAPRKPVTTIRAEWFADGTPATCTCGHTDCDHVLNAQTFAKVRGSVSAVWEEVK